MIALVIFLSITIIASIVFGVLFFSTNRKLKQLVKSISSNQRIGYYDDNNNYGRFDARIYVTEVERYTNGKSKLKFLKMENLNSSSPYSYDKFKSTFICPELKNTNDIDWLIVEENIKQQRLKKLKELGL